MRAPLLIALIAFAALAGCTAKDETAPGPVATVPGAPVDLAQLVNQTGLASMSFTPRLVTAAVDITGDLYEPTIEVTEAGSIFITGHTILVDTTGAPVFGSYDDGVNWVQLPWLNALTLPSPIQGATPPPSDEIFLAAGDDGWLYGVDITLATFPVNGWSHEGRIHAYHNPNAYDETKATPNTESGCVPAPIKDRPWGAYENGTLLMVSNDGAGPLQLGLMSMPPARYVGVGAVTDGIQWNLCAGPGTTPASCSIPGVPDIAANGRFAAPQLCQGTLHVAVGHKSDINAIDVVPVFEHSSLNEITSVYGHAVFDANNTLFVGISNNTARMDGTSRVPADGGMNFAVSVDGGTTFVNRTFTMPGQPLRHFYMDANEKGPGALVVWAVNGETRNAANTTIAWDWYVGHLQLGADGYPELTGAYLAINEGPQPSAHVTGAAVGPDGRAYLAMYGGGAALGSATLPLSVYVQLEGPTLPTW